MIKRTLALGLLGLLAFGALISVSQAQDLPQSEEEIRKRIQENAERNKEDLPPNYKEFVTANNLTET